MAELKAMSGAMSVASTIEFEQMIVTPPHCHSPIGAHTIT